MADRVGLRDVRYGHDGENHLELDDRRLATPTSTSTPAKCIVCSRCVRACDEIQGTFALTIEGRGFDSQGRRRRGTIVHGVRVRVVRRLRAGLPDRRAHRSSRSSSSGMPTRTVLTTCAYCGVGCSFKAEMQGDEVVRMVPVQGRRRQRGPLVREGPLRVRLRQPPRPRADADDPRVDRRRVARGRAGTRRSRSSPAASARSRTSTASARSAAITLVALHQRRGLRRPEDGARGVRQQQRRHLRAGLPLAHRLRPEADVRHVGRHAGLQVGRPGRRHPGDRRQPDRRPPGVRVADEAAAARGRAADRRRPAPDRPRPHAARRGRTPPAARARAPTSRSSTRWRTWSSPRASSTDDFVAERCEELRRVGRRSSPGPRTARRRSRRSPACRPPSCAPRPGSTPPAATPPSTTASASPSTARARRW